MDVLHGLYEMQHYPICLSVCLPVSLVSVSLSLSPLSLSLVVRVRYSMCIVYRQAPRSILGDVTLAKFASIPLSLPRTSKKLNEIITKSKHSWSWGGGEGLNHATQKVK